METGSAPYQVNPSTYSSRKSWFNPLLVKAVFRKYRLEKPQK